MHCDDYRPVPTRTGYERVLAHRVDPIYANTAKKPGTVTKITKTSMLVTYDDGELVHYELGRKFGIWSGKTIPHQLATTLKVGEKVDAGTILTYNSNFFDADTLSPGQVVYKAGVLARTVLWESADTLEDSCALSADFNGKLSTTATHIRYIKVSFDQDVRNMVQVGESVDADSILCTVLNPVGGNSDLFNDAALDILKAIANLNPRAKHEGVIEKIEVLYSGDVEEMSDSLRQLVDKSDEELYRYRRMMKLSPASGNVDASYRCDGKPIGIDTVAIKVYITGPVGMGAGDKVVFAHQMKSIVGRIITTPITTEDGKPVDAIFGYQSIANRIARSPELLGTTNTLLLLATDDVVKTYFSDEAQ